MIAVLVLVVVWGVSPGTPYTGPGNPLQFTRGDLTDTAVIGLTVDNGEHDLNAENFRRYWTRYTPLWFNALILRSQLGEGQAEARQYGLTSARELVGEVETPRPVHPGRVTGTSSGLAWAVAAMATRYPGLTSDGLVAATGTLMPNGDVIGVGGVEEKMATPALEQASVILVPSAQLDQFRRARADISPAGSPLIGVRTVSEALGVLCLINELSEHPCDRYRSGAAESAVEVRLSANNLGLCDLTGLDARNFTCKVEREFDLVISSS
jgi:hypothetical protein